MGTFVADFVGGNFNLRCLLAAFNVPPDGIVGVVQRRAGDEEAAWAWGPADTFPVLPGDTFEMRWEP